MLAMFGVCAPRMPILPRACHGLLSIHSTDQALYGTFLPSPTLMSVIFELAHSQAGSFFFLGIRSGVATVKVMVLDGGDGMSAFRLR